MPRTKSARIAIVGGGFAGAATAYHLVSRGHTNVVVLEREQTLGQHASGRNAGMCRRITDDDAVTELTAAGAEFLRRPPANFCDRPLVVTTGSVLTSSNAARLDSMARTASAIDTPHRLIDRRDIEALWPELAGPMCDGGLLVERDGLIDTAALLGGFIEGARAGGADIVVGADVSRIEQSGSRVELVTACGVFDADVVVNAAGAWAEPVGQLAGAGAAMQCYLRHVFVTERPVPEAEQRPFVWYVDPDEMYVRPYQGRLMISPCDRRLVAPCDAAADETGQALMLQRIEQTAPGLRDHGLSSQWACLRTFAGTPRPVIEWDERCTWLFWVAGLGGHGATACAAIGERASAFILERI